MAFDLALRRQNSLNLTQSSGSDYSWGEGDSIGSRLSLEEGAKRQVEALRKNVDDLNKQISAWYNANKTNPAAGPFVNPWITWRNQVYGYLKAFNPSNRALVYRFREETAPKEKELLEFKKKFQLISGTKPGATYVAPRPVAPRPVTPPPAAAKPKPKPIIRTPAKKPSAKKPVAVAKPSVPTPMPPPLPPEEPGKGRLLLIAGAAAAAAGGGFLLLRSRATSSAPARR